MFGEEPDCSKPMCRSQSATFMPRFRAGAGSAASVAKARRGRAAALERVKGIEPSYAAWEAAVLPLNYTRAAAACAVYRSAGQRRNPAMLLAQIVQTDYECT